MASAVLSGMKTGYCGMPFFTGCSCWARSPARSPSRCETAIRTSPGGISGHSGTLAVHRYFVVDWAVVWQISQEEVPVLEEQVMGIMRAEFPELAKTYESDAVSGPEGTAGPSPEDAA